MSAILALWDSMIGITSSYELSEQHKLYAKDVIQSEAGSRALENIVHDDNALLESSNADISATLQREKNRKYLIISTSVVLVAIFTISVIPKKKRGRKWR